MHFVHINCCRSTSIRIYILQILTSAINVSDHPGNAAETPFAQIHPADFRAHVARDIRETQTSIATTSTNAQTIGEFAAARPNVKTYRGPSNAHVSTAPLLTPSPKVAEGQWPVPTMVNARVTPFVPPVPARARSPTSDPIAKIRAIRLLASPMPNALFKTAFPCADACQDSNFCPSEGLALTSMSARPLPPLVGQEPFAKIPSDRSVANVRPDYRVTPQEAAPDR